jgi:hypothetical protein
MTDKMTPAEKADFRRAYKAQGQVLIARAEQEAAHEYAELLRQLDAVWKAQDFQVEELLKEAKLVAKEANRQIDARCKELGIGERFRPRVRADFCRQYVADRERAEIKARLKAENTERIKRIKAAWSEKIAEFELMLATQTAESEAATAMVAKMPTPRELLGTLDLSVIPGVGKRLAALIEAVPAGVNETEMPAVLPTRVERSAIGT